MRGVDVIEVGPKYRPTLPERPERIRKLPLSKTGYPIPWFVATLPDGTRDFRIVSSDRLHEAVRFKKCWVCGQALGGYLAFTIGPMCSVNRISAEPPAHRDCAQYSAVACPFLTHPEMVRRDTGIEELGGVKPPGMLEHNPGVTLVWVCRDFAIRVHEGRALFQIGDPVATDWYCRGQKANKRQVLDAFTRGVPALWEVTGRDEQPAKSQAHLATQVGRALMIVDDAFGGDVTNAGELLAHALNTARA